jgi:hypothetical protein
MWGRTVWIALKVPFEVHRDDTVPVGFRHLEQGPAVRDPGVGHQDVDAAEGIQQRGDHVLHGAAVRDISGERQGPAAEIPRFPDRGAGEDDLLRIGEMVDPDRRALAGQRQSDLSPDAPTGAGHQRHLAIDPACAHLFSPCAPRRR